MQGIDHGPTPWWGKTHLRMLVLLAILAGVAAYGIPIIVQRANGDSPAIRCGVAQIPPQPLWSLAKLRAVVAASGLAALVGDGTPDLQGLQTPDAAWTDGYPTPKTAPDPAITPGGAGYEIRWWSPGNDHQGVDMFVFSSPSDAARYVAVAATANCRRDARLYTVRRPMGGRAVIWTNPVGALEADVLVARGRRAYVTFEVPPIGVRPPPRRLIAVPADLACELHDVGCT